MNLKKQEQILEIMESRNMISIKELAGLLSCTEMTVRRNLDDMQARNLVKREHGYATLLATARPTDYNVEIHEHSEEKKKIAAAAVSYLSAGQSICLDSGTTVLQMAGLIPSGLPLSVITPSLETALALAPNPDIQVLMPGGFLDHSNRALLINDPQEMEKYKVDIAFLSCRSFRLPGGTFEHSQKMMSTKRAIASIAQKKILLLDHSKWDSSSIFSCIPLSWVDVIITDKKAPEEQVEKARELGVEVVIAE